MLSGGAELYMLLQYRMLLQVLLVRGYMIGVNEIEYQQ